MHVEIKNIEEYKFKTMTFIFRPKYEVERFVVIGFDIITANLRVKFCKAI